MTLRAARKYDMIETCMMGYDVGGMQNGLFARSMGV